MSTNMAADRKWDDATRKRIIELYKQGAKLKAIAGAEGVPMSTIYNLLKEAGEGPSRMTRRKTAPNGARAQVETLEWLTQRLFEQQTQITQLLDETARMRSLLLEWGIDPDTGEELPE